jgi:hypothetical protein
MQNVTLYGTIPSNFANLITVTQLYVLMQFCNEFWFLDNNQLNGTIPDLTQMASLTELYVSVFTNLNIFSFVADITQGQ